MAFTFIHTADWQIGKAFGRFDPEKAPVLRRARLDVIDRIAQSARHAGAAHILVAGDVFDGEALADALLAQTLARLAAHPHVTWHLLPGNHDPARPGGIWQAVQRLSVPPNVRLHLEPQAAEIAAGVYLLPAPLKAKSTSTDPTGWMDLAATPVHALRIGLAHGSIKGFGNLGEAAVPIDPARPKLAGLGFLAIGDWHGMMAIGERLWYSGTPEPDSFADNDPGYVLAVTVGSANAPPDVKPILTSQFTWADRHVTLADAAGLAPLEAELERFGPGIATCLLNLTLSGRVPLARLAAIEAKLERIKAPLFDLRLDRAGLSSVASSDDIDEITDAGLRAVAGRLRAMSEDSAAPDQHVAALALERLAALAATAVEGERIR